MKEVKAVTKILFIDGDELGFQIRQCIANALQQLPPVELYHAIDASAGLKLLQSVHPDVVILDDEQPEQCQLFIESAAKAVTALLVQTKTSEKRYVSERNVSYLRKNSSLAGIHETLLVATSLAMKGIPSEHLN